MSARLATAVTIHLKSGQSRLLLPGYEPTVDEAALITNPACWVDGVLPTAEMLDAPDDVFPDASWNKSDIEAWVKANGLNLPAGLKKEDLLTAIDVWVEQQDSEEVENAAADSDSVGDTQ